MNRYPSQQVVYAPPGPSALILPGVILAPLGLVGLAAGLEVMKRDFFIGVVCCVPGALVFAFWHFAWRSTSGLSGSGTGTSARGGSRISGSTAS